MKTKLLASLAVAALAFCASAAPIPSYRVATNIAEAVSHRMVTNTVTKAYVEDLGIEAGISAATNALASNVYTKEETDAKIVELSPPTSLAPATNYTDAALGQFAATGTVANAEHATEANRAGEADGAYALVDNDVDLDYRTAAQIFAQIDSKTTTNDVCVIVTNEVAEYTTNDTWICNNPTGESWAPEWNGTGWRMPIVEILLPEDATSYTLKDEQSQEPGQGDYIFTRIASSKRNTLGLARLSDIAPTVSNTVTKSYVEGLGIEAGISADTATNIAQDITTNYVDIALANRPTKSQMDEGWWSEWTVSPASFVFEGRTYEPVVTRDFNIETGEYEWDLSAYDFGSISSVPYIGEESDLTFVDYTGETGFDSFTATRHRVAAPVPTKISDLTNDVGYVTATITNSLASTNYVDNATNSLSTSFAHTIATADTTYRRTIGLTNLNQSVQYVNITDPAPTTLEITMPTDGATKDWMVYVTSVTNVSLVLPSATWWMADTAYTNDVPPATPTALYFSQIGAGLYLFSRQELTEVATP